MDKVQLGQRYIFKDILPQIYQYAHNRAMYLLKRDQDEIPDTLERFQDRQNKIQDRLDNLGIIFEEDSIEETRYNRVHHAVILSLPSYSLKKNYSGVDQNEHIILLNDIQQFVSSDVSVQGFIIHETMHSFQDLRNNKAKQLDYSNQFDKYKLGKIKYEDIDYELGAILESIFYNKKQGITLDDIKKKVNYHLFNKYKERAEIFKDCEKLYNFYNLLNKSNLSKEIIKETKDDIVKIKNNITNKIGILLYRDFSNFDNAMYHFKKYIRDHYKYETLYKVIDRIEKYWNKDKGWQIGDKRGELPRDLWAFIIKETVKYANVLDQCGFYKKADVCDDFTQEIFYGIN